MTKTGIRNRRQVFVHLGTDDQPDSSDLLDMTPETSPLSDDAFLDVGKSFTDPVSGVTLTTLSVSSTSATIMVDMAATPCTRSAPTVTTSPAQSPTVQPGTAVTYTVFVTNTDSAACGASSFALQATAATTDWQTSFDAPNVTTNPGATGSSTLEITSSPAEMPGSYTIVATATSTTDSTLSGSAPMLYTISDDGDPEPPWTFTDNFDRPDSPELGNGWSVVTGSFMIQSLEGRNEVNNTSSLAVQPGLMGATQTVAASFASTDNNSSPRFVVVVRYQDLENYYMCYRQLGGSSIVRIAKVQGGAETVLKSLGIGNPARNALSKLSCEASGTTLTLRIDGVMKLSTSDDAFSTGNAGFAISAQKIGSQRVENFSATVTTP